MKEQILYELFQNPNNILIEQIYYKYHYIIHNYAQYIINNNFKRLSILETNFESNIINIIKKLKNFDVNYFKKFNLETILKKLTLQEILLLSRKQNNNKNKILHYAYDESTQFDFNYNNVYEFDQYKLFYDDYISKMQSKLNENYKKQIFKLYIDGYNPNEISRIINIDIKKIYNVLYYIKKNILKIDLNKFLSNV